MGALRYPESRALAELSRGARRVLDAGVGHGRFGLELLREKRVIGHGAGLGAGAGGGAESRRRGGRRLSAPRM
jgi:hypothetical protein